jgi:AraC-like DNA-binding protein
LQGGWRPLFGSVERLGFSFEWHDFKIEKELEWSRSFHPGCLELCLNLEGGGWLEAGGSGRVEVPPSAQVFYFQGAPPLSAIRRKGERHRFVTVEFSPEFIVGHLGNRMDQLHPLVKEVVTGKAKESRLSPPERLSTTHMQLMDSLRQCPVFEPAQEIWFRCKALELAAHLFFKPESEFFCTRAQRVARERVDMARAILREELAAPPSLEELGKRVGCSPFYLSRLFSQENGMTIQQFLRQLRMERAAELLKRGDCNVTEAAFAVGYSSLGHFSTAFHQTFGCCPGLYPLKTSNLKKLASLDRFQIPRSETMNAKTRSSKGE